MIILHIYQGDGFGRKGTVHWNELRVRNEEYPQFAAVAAFSFLNKKLSMMILHFREMGSEERGQYTGIYKRIHNKNIPLQWLDCIDDRLETIILCM